MCPKYELGPFINGTAQIELVHTGRPVMIDLVVPMLFNVQTWAKDQLRTTSGPSLSVIPFVNLCLNIESSNLGQRSTWATRVPSMAVSHAELVHTGRYV